MSLSPEYDRNTSRVTQQQSTRGVRRPTFERRRTLHKRGETARAWKRVDGDYSFGESIGKAEKEQREILAWTSKERERERVGRPMLSEFYKGRKGEEVGDGRCVAPVTLPSSVHSATYLFLVFSSCGSFVTGTNPRDDSISLTKYDELEGIFLA